MKDLKTIGFVAVTVLLAFSCSTTPPSDKEVNLNSVKTEITNLEAAYTKASNAKDVEGILAYYAEDAQSLAPNEEVRIGKKNIKSATTREMVEKAEGTISTMEVTSVWASGNIAVETGTWTNTDQEGIITSKGKYISLFEIQNGKYVCIRDIWNSDMPAKEVAMVE